jgi:ribonuclease HII
VDEAGRGPMAGPVCAAVAVFRPGTTIRGVNDSKKLTPATRERLFDEIMASARSVGIGLAHADEIDAINILNATKLAVRRALRQLRILPQHLLLDALHIADCTIPQESLVKGDARSFSIAAASIVAKVTRDRLMRRYHDEYPQYGFIQHKGYPTGFHMEQVMKHGMSTLHRRTFFDPGLFAPHLVYSQTFTTLAERIRQAGDRATVDAVIYEARSLDGFLPGYEIRELAAIARAWEAH